MKAGYTGNIEIVKRLLNVDLISKSVIQQNKLKKNTKKRQTKQGAKREKVREKVVERVIKCKTIHQQS